MLYEMRKLHNIVGQHVIEMRKHHYIVDQHVEEMRKQHNIVGLQCCRDAQGV